MQKTDCLIIGFNDSNFEEYVKMVRSMGEDSGAFKDLDLAFIDYAGKPQHSLDILNHFYNEDRPNQTYFHNADFLWPVVLYLTSFLAKRGISVDYVNLFQAQQDELRAKLLEDSILTIAITTTLYVSAHPIIEIINFIRQYNTKAQIVVGGPFISNQFKVLDGDSLQSLFKYLDADIYVTCQEGELALSNLISTLKQGFPLDFVDNIAFRHKDGFFVTKSSGESNSLEANLVDYSLFPSEQIGQFISTRTAKSCPYACAFCGFPQRAGKYTYTSVETVEKELNEIAAVGTVTTLTFLDDTFNVPKTRFKEILQMMIRNQYGFKWNSFYRSDQGDAETIELMRQAGCEGVFLGAESGSDTMLQHMNKTSRRHNYIDAIKHFRKAGISTYTSLIVGFPGETYATVQETIDFLEEAQPDFFRAQLWYCDPLTPIWQKRDEYHISGSAFNWSHKTMDSRTACDLIDRMFLSVENAIWLPQFGFEQWSTFYLQRHGLQLSQIKNFLRGFNTAIKEKIIYPGKRDVSLATIDMLRQTCQFDRYPQPTMQPAEQLNAAGYKAAERFWIELFRDHGTESQLQALRTTKIAPRELATSQHMLPATQVIGLARELAVEPIVVILAGLSMLLASLNGREDVSFIVGLDTITLPLRVQPRRDQTFESLVKTIQAMLQSAQQNKLYAFHIMSNPYRMAQFGGRAPSFDLYVHYSNQSGQATSLAERLPHYPSIWTGIDWEIECRQDLAINSTINQAKIDQMLVEAFFGYVGAALEKAADHPEWKLGAFGTTATPMVDGSVLEDDAEAMFNF